jgi:hypothetical protein
MNNLDEEKELMKSQTVLLATWRDGLFIIGDEGQSQEPASVPIKWVAPDGHGGALVIVGQNSLSHVHVLASGQRLL